MTIYECFILYRVRWIRKVFGKQLILMIVRRCKKMPPEACLTLLHALLMTSHNPEFSQLLLTLLLSFPEEVLERDAMLKVCFARQSLKSSSVREGISICQAALNLSFGA